MSGLREGTWLKRAPARWCNFRHAWGGLQFGKHLVETATRYAQNQDTGRRIVGIAKGTASAACAVEEAAGPDATRRGLAFELDQELTTQWNAI